MSPLSILDLAPVPEGSDAAVAQIVGAGGRDNGRQRQCGEEGAPSAKARPSAFIIKLDKSNLSGPAKQRELCNRMQLPLLG
jgi:hypothetical protein